MWIFYALIAAVLWGLNYSLAERVLQNVSAVTLLAMEMLLGAVVFGAIGYFTDLKKDMLYIADNPTLGWILASEVVVVCLASFFIVYSIQAKNATAAAIIELIYPLFTILFTWALFGENHITWSVIAGGILIFIGVLLISH